MKPKSPFAFRVCVAYLSLAAVLTIEFLGLETRREVFVLWEFIGNVCRGILLLYSSAILVYTIRRWGQLSSKSRIIGIGPTICIAGFLVFSFALDYARPNIRLFVEYDGKHEEIDFAITTHSGSSGMKVKPGQELMVSEGRGFPSQLSVVWGTNYSRQFSKEFDLKEKIHSVGDAETIRVTLSDGEARLDIQNGRSTSPKH